MRFSLLARRIGVSVLLPAVACLPKASGEDTKSGSPDAGKAFYGQSCALCHADSLGAGGTEIEGQGPSLVGVVSRRAGSQPNFSFTKAMKSSGIVWDLVTLDQFLADPNKMVPGTTMPISVSDAANRRDVIAYLATLKLPAEPPPAKSAVLPVASGVDLGDWHQAAPGVKHHLFLKDLPPPYSTGSSGNAPLVVKQPDGAALSVPPGFSVKLLADGLSNPRILRVAPNGDLFVAETAANRLRVLRLVDGAGAPASNQIFAEGLDRPFGIAFYPPGNDPKWIYIANNNSVVRFPYRNGDLKASGESQVIVPKLTDSHGGHSTRDVAFSLDGKRLFISVGSGSNVAEQMSKKSVDDAHAWEAGHGKGAGWDAETNRADILVTDPEGREPIHPYATGIRNGVGIAVNPDTGDLWTSANERDGLGDNLVPDYITRVKEGAYYGWPWFYLGNHEDPRHAGERLDLAEQALVPDVLLQAHSASLEMCFYTATGGSAVFPPEYRGDIFAAEHGSWNRSTRTGYKIIRIRLHHGVPTGEYDDFLTGFVVDASSVWGRPVGVAVTHDGALIMAEDGNGTLWRISYSKP